MKVCLIGYYDEGQYGLRCLEATLEEAGHEVDIIVMKSYFNMFIPPTEREYELLTDLIRDLKPGLIGITVRSPFVWLAKEITVRLRDIGTPILWGGFHATVAPEYSLKQPDMILRGEADRTLPMLADALSNSGDLSEIPGLWYREGDEIRKNPLPPPIEDLDSLPLPVLRVDHRWFIEANQISDGDPLIISQNPFYATMASRGCPQHCTYCANAALVQLYGKGAKRIRMRSPERVVEEVKRFRELKGNLSIVGFVDEVFGYKPKWVGEFCRLWKKEVDIPFSIEMFPTQVSEKIVTPLREAGLKFVNMGVQSGSERVRKEIYQRPGPNKQILNSARILYKYGINYRLEFIFGNPLEEAEDLKETLHFLLEMPRPYVWVSYQLTYFPGNPLTERFLKDGIIKHEDVQGYTEEMYPRWDVTVDLNDGHSNDYHFYLCLILITNFRYFTSDPWDTNVRPHFYPRWVIRWLEKQDWLRRNPRRMLYLADKMGRFAHWSYFWISYFPKRLANKTLTAARLIVTGDFKSFGEALGRFGRRIGAQLGFSPKATPCPEPALDEGQDIKSSDAAN